MSHHNLLRRLTGLACALGLAAGVASAFAQTSLRLSTLKMPGSDGAKAAEAFAKEVEAGTQGRVKIKVYPANQLGDWAEVYEQVMQGAVDMAMQPVATSDDKRLAVTWFPYAFTDYDSAEKALTTGGAVFEIVNGAIGEKGLTLLGVFGEGMGGAGFAKPVDNPADPNAKRNLKVRVWPGGTTHRALLERFGYNTATLPWAELYTGMQTGLVDGQIGGTANMALESFKDITKTWVQFNDHFESDWLFINSKKHAALSAADKKVLLDAAQKLTRQRFQDVKKADEKALQTMRDMGVKVVTFNKQQLESLAGVARKEVWPKIADEIGQPTMNKLRASVGAQ